MKQAHIRWENMVEREDDLPGCSRKRSELIFSSDTLLPVEPAHFWPRFTLDFPKFPAIDPHVDWTDQRRDLGLWTCDKLFCYRFWASGDLIWVSHFYDSLNETALKGMKILEISYHHMIMFSTVSVTLSQRNEGRMWSYIASYSWFPLSYGCMSDFKTLLFLDIHCTCCRCKTLNQFYH